MLGRRLAHKLGLTKEKVEELSETLYETAMVASREHTKEESFPSYTYTYAGFRPYIRYGNPVYGRDHYHVRLDGAVSFYLDDESLYNSLQEGDGVRVAYKKVDELVYDYVSPDFKNKRLVKREFLRNEVVSVERV